MSLLILLLLTFTLSTFPLTINPNLQNSSHEIYTITDGIKRSDIIYCSSTNCVIECINEDSCTGIIINAIDIENVNINCNSYDSCDNIQINANNGTKVNMNCLYAHSCTQSNIFVINSYIQLLCNREDSCLELSIFINKPLQNAIDLSCKELQSCVNLQIKLLNLLSNTNWINSNWLNVPYFVNDFDIKLICDENNNISLVYSTELNDIQCTKNMICCPLNYFSYNETDATFFYSTTQNIFVPELSDLFLFQYFTTFILPLLCISVIYTILVFIWAMVYGSCNTIPTYLKLKSLTNKPPSFSAICEGSSFWNKCGYCMDGLNPLTDIVAVMLIFTHSYLSNNTKAWFILGYLSQGAMAFGIFFYILKLILLNKFYPYILLWRMRRDKLSKYTDIERKNNKISLLLKHLILFDLFSASISDGLMSFVILCICIDLNDGDFFSVLLLHNWNEIEYFEWILRIKLFICYIFMFYAIFKALSVECLCHKEKMTSNNNKNRNINSKSIHIYKSDDNYQSIKDDTDGDYDSDINKKTKKNQHNNSDIHTNNTETETFIERKYNDVEMEALNNEDDDLKLAEVNVNISDNKSAQQFIKTVQNMSTFHVQKHGEHNNNSNNNLYVQNDAKEEEEEKTTDPIDSNELNSNTNNESIETKENETVSDNNSNNIIKNMLKVRPRRRSTGSKSQALLDSKHIHQSHIISKSDHFVQTKIKLMQWKDENSQNNNDKIIETQETVNNNVEENENNDLESMSQNTEIIYDSHNDSVKEYTPNSRSSDSRDSDAQQLELNSND